MKSEPGFPESPENWCVKPCSGQDNLGCMKASKIRLGSDPWEFAVSFFLTP